MTNYLTQQDVDNYGSDLLDVTQRVAMQTVAPYLQQLQHDNADLRARQAQEQRRRLDQEVAALVPNFREIDRDPRWHQYLLGVDLMSGRIRQQLLNEAVANGHAARVKSIFDGFQQQQEGQSGSGRASGRARSSEKPFYSRADILRLYDQHRRGAFAGRESEWARIEADIFRAQHEGRVEFKPCGEPSTARPAPGIAHRFG